MLNEVARMDGLEQAQAVARGVLSAAELLEACLLRIERLDPLLGAITDLKRHGGASLASGPFRGVHFSSRTCSRGRGFAGRGLALVCASDSAP